MSSPEWDAPERTRVCLFYSRIFFSTLFSIFSSFLYTQQKQNPVCACVQTVALGCYQPYCPGLFAFTQNGGY